MPRRAFAYIRDWRIGRLQAEVDLLNQFIEDNKKAHLDAVRMRDKAQRSLDTLRKYASAAESGASHG